MPVLDAFQQSLKHLQEVAEKIAAADKDLAARRSDVDALQKQHHELMTNQHRIAASLASIPASHGSSFSPDAAAAALHGGHPPGAPKPEDPRQKLLREQKELADKEQAAVKRRSELEGAIQAAQRQAAEQRQRRQEALKNAFLVLKQAIDKCHATQSRVIRLLVLERIDDDLKRAKLQPQELDQLFDKSFAADILHELGRVNAATQAQLQLTDQFDLDRWKALPGEITALTDSIRSQEENLRTLPGRLEETRLNLAQTERQHELNAEARDSSSSQAKWAGIAALVIGLIVGGVGFAVPEALWGLILPGAVAIFALVQAIRSASLDLSGTIDQLKREGADLARQVNDMPRLQEKLAADKALLQQSQREFEEIHGRHPELRGFNLRQF